MGLFTSKLVEKVLDTGSNITSKVIGNSKNANQLDARDNNQVGFLDGSIHEIMVLLIFFAVIFADKIGVPDDIRKDLMVYLGMCVSFLFGRSGKR